MVAGVSTDLTRKKDFSQKKTASVVAARVTYDMVDSTNFNEIFNLPPNALVTDVAMVTKVSGQTNLTVDFGSNANEDLLLDEVTADESAGHVHTVGYDISGLTLTEATPNTYLSGSAVKTPRIDTGTGLTLGPSFSAQPTVGEWVFIVEFIEYDLANGQLLNLGSGAGVTTV